MQLLSFVDVQVLKQMLLGNLVHQNMGMLLKELEVLFE
jgi:hypothetical protein